MFQQFYFDQTINDKYYIDRNNTYHIYSTLAKFMKKIFTSY